MSVSRVELAFNDLIACLEAIMVSNGYRNDLVRNGVSHVGSTLKTLDEVKDRPEAVVCFGEGTVSGIDTACTGFSEEVPVAVFGFVGAAADPNQKNKLVAAGESLLHDFKKALAGFITQYMNDSTKMYFILPQGKDSSGSQKLFTIKRLLADRGETGIVGIFFTIKIRSESSSFA